MTDRAFLRRFLRLAGSGALLLALCLACTVSEGERAATGACPEGEVCSDDTPSGLSFYGPLPGDDPAGTGFLRRIAMGGTSSLAFSSGSFGLSEEEDPAESGRLGEWAVESTAPWFVEIDGEAEPSPHATWTTDESVQLRGLAEGETTLRVYEPGSGALYDRITLGVERIRRVDGRTLGGARTDELAAGASGSVIFRLFGEEQTRLVDEGLTVESELPFERVSWDCVDLDVPADAEEVTFIVAAGHRRWEVRVPVR
ncbi:MAG TPA: hypothetical protein RMH99_32625 [Sandaracinaceae bacterium LLY-WYZ-13_1]|nr:hypothetical protein [Sandaracinaceae bacterium LLY-WYZ-13_1]